MKTLGNTITAAFARGLMLRWVVLLSALLLAACVAPPGPPAPVAAGGREPLVDRAVAALGGVAALEALRSASIRGTVRHWEPEQSHVAGGEARFAAESSYELTLDFVNRVARTDWIKKFAYPTARVFRYTELVTPVAGYIAGIDSNVRNAMNFATSPPAHSMSGLRLAVTQRELRRASPVLLLEMYDNPGRVARMANQQAGGVSYPAVSYTFANHRLIVMFDPQSGLPARVRSLDYDNIWGDVAFDVVLTEWQPAGGVRIAMSQRYELNGRVVAQSRYTQVTPNVTLNAAGMSLPANRHAAAARPSMAANLPYQWVIRRQFIGTYLDSENTSFDTVAATPGLRLHELAPGVHHVVGGSHNALVVNLRDHLIVFDAPVSDWQSNWTLRAAHAQFGVKPVRYLVLTHHHMDHAGGLRSYLAQGATLVVGRGTAAHYRRVLAAPATRNPDLPAHDFSRAQIVEVADRHVMGDGQRNVSAHLIENPHVEGMLIGYVADARIGFVTDIWSPGATPLAREMSSPLAALVNATRRAGISPLRFAGGHGGSAEYAPLAGLANLK